MIMRTMQIPEHLAAAVDRAIQTGSPLSVPADLRQDSEEIRGVRLPGYLEYVVGEVSPRIDSVSGAVNFPAFPLVDCRQAHRVSFLVANRTNTVLGFKLVGSPVGGHEFRASRVFALSPVFVVKTLQDRMFHVDLDALFAPWVTVQGLDQLTGGPTYGTDTDLSTGTVTLTAFMQKRFA